MLLLRQITILACQFTNRGGATVPSFVRPLLILSATMLIMVACTRERPTPEPTATPAAQVNAPTAAVTASQTLTGTAPTESGEAAIAVTNTPNSLTATPDGTSTPGTPETFQYIVQAGDTLGGIAMRFETDVETLRGLNTLVNDAIAVGQPLNVPYREGMTAEGMPTPTPGPFEYTVQAGDTLSGLAVRFGVNTMAILEANSGRLLDPNNLAVGTTIIIPNYQPPAAASTPGATDSAGGAAGGVTHVVQSGEGLLQISVTYGVPVADIMAANGLTDQDVLRIGQELTIPGVTARDIAVAQGNVHIVQPGESLLSISLQYGLTVAEIQEANELPNPDSIFSGQELIIPAP